MVLDRYFQELLIKHSTNGLLIDTNLLLLFAIGKYDRRRIGSFKRTAVYTVSDFQRLGWLVTQFKKLWTTPNILTEVDNLGRQLPEREWRGFALSLTGLAIEMTEEMVPSVRAMKAPIFARIGLSDAVAISTGRTYLLLSDDLRLCLAAQAAGYDAINFNHLRMQSL